MSVAKAVTNSWANRFADDDDLMPNPSHIPLSPRSLLNYKLHMAGACIQLLLALVPQPSFTLVTSSFQIGKNRNLGPVQEDKDTHSDKESPLSSL